MRNVRMDVGEPMLIRDTTVEGVKLILKWAAWFDRLDARLAIHEDFQQHLQNQNCPPALAAMPDGFPTEVGK